jgi:hypothetical protein
VCSRRSAVLQGVRGPLATLPDGLWVRRGLALGLRDSALLHNGSEYMFCSLDCAQKFAGAAERYSSSQPPPTVRKFLGAKIASAPSVRHEGSPTCMYDRRRDGWSHEDFAAGPPGLNTAWARLVRKARNAASVAGIAGLVAAAARRSKTHGAGASAPARAQPQASLDEARRMRSERSRRAPRAHVPLMALHTREIASRRALPRAARQAGRERARARDRACPASTARSRVALRSSHGARH